MKQYYHENQLIVKRKLQISLQTAILCRKTMRKEVSIAIIIGVILGGIILYGINFANNGLSTIPKPTPTPTITPLPTSIPSNPNAAANSTLSITSHIDGQVLFEKDIVLTGKANPNASVSIIWEDNEEIISADATGNFSQKITLVAGENNIQVDTTKSDKTLDSKVIKIFYSSKIIE